jgi:hypothetical protein
MNWLRRLFGGGAPPDQALHLYVRCGHCGAPLHVRAHLFNDLAVEYDEGEGVAGYHLHKEMMDGRCFRLMYADVAFDRNRRELSRTIEGGEFISADEYQRLVAATTERR